MPGPITADQVKDRLGQTHAALVNIVPKWEQSGTGFGAEKRPFDVDGSGFGRMTEEIIVGETPTS